MSIRSFHASVSALIYRGAFEMPEPDEELRGMVERIADREIRNVPTR